MNSKIRMFIFLQILFCTKAQAGDIFSCTNEKLNLDRVYYYIHQIKDRKYSYSDSTSSNSIVKDIEPELYGDLFENCIYEKIDENSIVKFNSPDLHRLYEAVNRIAFYTNNLDGVRYMELILDEKVKRSEDITNLKNDLYKIYIKTRQFSKAATLQSNHPELNFPLLPKIENSPFTGRSLLHIEENGKKLVRELFVFPKGGYVVVVSSPMCNPSRRALAWIKSKPALLDVFINHATWIMPVDGRLYINEVLENNQSNAPIVMKYTYLESEWPEIEYWGTPTFYFYQDSKLIQQIVGWPPEGREKELTKALEEVDLINP